MVEFQVFKFQVFKFQIGRNIAALTKVPAIGYLDPVGGGAECRSRTVALITHVPLPTGAGQPVNRPRWKSATDAKGTVT